MNVEQQVLESNIESLNELYKENNLKFELDGKNGIVIVREPKSYWFGSNTSIRDKLKSNFKMEFSDVYKWYIKIQSLNTKTIRFKPKLEDGVMQEKLMDYIGMIDDSSVRNTIYQILQDLPYFYTCPSAYYHHHNYKYGLIEHTLEVTKIAIELMKLTLCDKNLVIAGAILHDIGKIHLYNVEPNGTSTMTENSDIKDHGVLGCGYITKYFGTSKFGIDLIHIISSHHGHQSWGALCEPKTLEAVIVHVADLISARSLEFYWD